MQIEDGPEADVSEVLNPAPVLPFDVPDANEHDGADASQLPVVLFHVVPLGQAGVPVTVT